MKKKRLVEAQPQTPGRQGASPEARARPSTCRRRAQFEVSEAAAVNMKTTVKIPDPLFRRAKSQAAERGQTLREGSRVILDTNALSAFVDGEAAIGEVLRRQARAAITVIVLSSATASRNPGTASDMRRG